ADRQQPHARPLERRRDQDQSPVSGGRAADSAGSTLRRDARGVSRRIRQSFPVHAPAGQGRPSDGEASERAARGPDDGFPSERARWARRRDEEGEELKGKNVWRDSSLKWKSRAPAASRRWSSTSTSAASSATRSPNVGTSLSWGKRIAS